jgi:hypothetical protein
MHSLHLSEVIKKFPFRWRLIYLGAVHRKKNNRIVYLLIYQCKVGTAIATWTRSRMSHFQRQTRIIFGNGFSKSSRPLVLRRPKTGGLCRSPRETKTQVTACDCWKHHGFRFWPSTSGYLHFSTAPESLPSWWTRAPPEPQKFVDDQH